MNNEVRSSYLTRDRVMGLLTDEEIATVCSAQAEISLAEGEEFLDLKHLNLGVRRSGNATATPMGRVLPKKAICESTWLELLRQITPGT